jgi:hypothetical protein
VKFPIDERIHPVDLELTIRHSCCSNIETGEYKRGEEGEKKKLIPENAIAMLEISNSPCLNSSPKCGSTQENKIASMLAIPFDRMIFIMIP